jgi:hypothetical protein
MAFHARTFSTSLVVTWCTTSPGDDVYALVSEDGTATFTPPVSGNWTALGAVQRTTFDGQSAQLFHFSGNGGQGAPSSPPASETWTQSGGVGSAGAVMMSFSGRKIGSTSYATQTLADSSHTPPFTASLTSGTGATGDDMFVLLALDPNNPVATTTMSTTGSPGTFSNQGTTAGGSSICPIGLSTINNITAGADGTISAAWTDTNDTAAAYMGWVVTINASASSFPVFMSSSG